MLKIFKNLYNYRELLKTNIKKEIRGKYKNSFLGVLWSFLNPLLQIAVYAIVFPLILRNTQENYVIFLCCGLIPWTFFSSAIVKSASTMIENGNIVKKVYFPREILPISVVSSECVNFIISTIIIVAFVIDVSLFGKNSENLMKLTCAIIVAATLIVPEIKHKIENAKAKKEARKNA